LKTQTHAVNARWKRLSQLSFSYNLMKLRNYYDPSSRVHLNKTSSCILLLWWHILIYRLRLYGEDNEDDSLKDSGSVSKCRFDLFSPTYDVICCYHQHTCDEDGEDGCSKPLVTVGQASTKLSRSFCDKTWLNGFCKRRSKQISDWSFLKD